MFAGNSWRTDKDCPATPAVFPTSIIRYPKILDTNVKARHESAQVSSLSPEHSILENLTV